MFLKLVQRFLPDLRRKRQDNRIELNECTELGHESLSREPYSADVISVDTRILTQGLATRSVQQPWTWYSHLAELLLRAHSTCITLCCSLV